MSLKTGCAIEINDELMDCFRPPSGNEFKNIFNSNQFNFLIIKCFRPPSGNEFKNIWICQGTLEATKLVCFRPPSGNEFKNWKVQQWEQANAKLLFSSPFGE